jgi:hypothetical protein
LDGHFGGRRFSPVEPPALLAYEGAEVVIIPAAADAEAELGSSWTPRAS